ncbi:unnamed protein product [Adineta steineri]|uniref:Cytochrome P450 n=1 Tax=Adineta steineri TaxID=433720 RepID=A0A813ZCR8_9BILA|nr:unnamed protein product [Adineta steineri]CAF0916707.1 unnamed protein product [Adineta steineri]
MLLLLIVFIFLAFLTIIYLKLIRPQKQLHDIFVAQDVPSEPFVPIFGQLFDIIRATKQNRGMEYFNELAKKHHYYFLLGLGPLTRFIIVECELLADVLSRSKVEYYEKTSFVINILKPLIGVHNLIVSKHAEYERARRMLNPAFHSINLQSTDSIRPDIQSNILTFSIIALSAFVKVLDELPFWGKHILDDATKTLNEFVDQSVIDRRNGKSSSLCSGQDLLDLLLSADDDQGEPFSDEQIRDEAVTFVLAGHDTTTCREEVGRILPNETIPTYEHLSDLQVIEAVLHETIRLYPAAPVYARQYIKEHTISNSNDTL